VRRAVPPLLALAIASCGGDSGDGGGGGTSAGPEPPARSGRPGPSTTASGGFPRTPACRRSAEATPEQTEGPYYKEGPPKRRSLLGVGVSGRRLSIRGRVLSTDCTPVARARVDFWQADGKGEYDNDGYRLRGYQLTDDEGRYRVETVVPGAYDGRTPHIHVKVGTGGRDVLTTQLYLPDEARNRSDPIFAPGTVVRLRRGPGTWRAAFDFVVEED
jgi:hypothetical protein